VVHRGVKREGVFCFSSYLLPLILLSLPRPGVVSEEKDFKEHAKNSFKAISKK
jgi:hypothetical protein